MHPGPAQCGGEIGTRLGRCIPRSGKIIKTSNSQIRDIFLSKNIL